MTLQEQPLVVEYHRPLVVPKDMVVVNLSVRMVDNRFRTIGKIKKKELPFQLHWFYDNDYFSPELFGFNSIEIDRLKHLSQQAYNLFEQATDHIISNNQLGMLDIPTFFHEAISNSWKNRHEIPMLAGRMDINGGIDGMHGKVIEFNADTCTTIPETILWQQIQGQQLKPAQGQFNNLSKDIESILQMLRRNNSHEQQMLVATSFGHDEDVMNCHAIIDIARNAGFNALYSDLEHLTFSATEGIFLPMGEEYEPVDILYKVIPWDWMYKEEPQLAMLIATIISKKLCIVLNPPFTAIWQHKKFLAYITKYFPNSVIAETYLDANALSAYVAKPILGRMGENIKIVDEGIISSKGDFGHQDQVFQKYYPLIKDKENFSYQVGMFYAGKPSAINLRAEKSKIITDECDFVSHYII